MKEPHFPHDRLDTSAVLVKALVALVAAAMTLIIMDASWRPACHGRADGDALRALGLSAPALIPAGRAGRHPEIQNIMVDLRFTPFWPLPDPDPIRMILLGNPS